VCTGTPGSANGRRPAREWRPLERDRGPPGATAWPSMSCPGLAERPPWPTSRRAPAPPSMRRLAAAIFPPPLFPSSLASCLALRNRPPGGGRNPACGRLGVIGQPARSEIGTGPLHGARSHGGQPRGVPRVAHKLAGGTVLCLSLLFSRWFPRSGTPAAGGSLSAKPCGLGDFTEGFPCPFLLTAA